MGRARAPVVLAAALVGLGACAAVQAAAPQSPVELQRFVVDFPSVGEATFEAVVPLPPAVNEVRRITWELRVRGLTFATGVEGGPLALHGRGTATPTVSFQVPLVVKHLAWREGPAFIDVAMRGAVEAAQPGAEVRVPFAARRELLVQNAPRLEVGEE